MKLSCPVESKPHTCYLPATLSMHFKNHHVVLFKEIAPRTIFVSAIVSRHTWISISFLSPGQEEDGMWWPRITSRKWKAATGNKITSILSSTKGGKKKTGKTPYCRTSLSFYIQIYVCFLWTFWTLWIQHWQQWSCKVKNSIIELVEIYKLRKRNAEMLGSFKRYFQSRSSIS